MNYAVARVSTISLSAVSFAKPAEASILVHLQHWHFTSHLSAAIKLNSEISEPTGPRSYLVYSWHGPGHALPFSAILNRSLGCSLDMKFGKNCGFPQSCESPNPFGKRLELDRSLAVADCSDPDDNTIRVRSDEGRLRKLIIIQR